MDDRCRFLRMASTGNDNDAIKSFRDWVRKTLTGS